MIRSEVFSAAMRPHPYRAALLPSLAATISSANILTARLEQQADAIHALNPFDAWGQGWHPVGTRAGLVEDVFTSGEISDVGEQTTAAYARFDFAFDTKMPIEGNIGVRYVEDDHRIGRASPVSARLRPVPTLCRSRAAGRTARLLFAVTGTHEAEFLSALHRGARLG